MTRREIFEKTKNCVLFSLSSLFVCHPYSYALDDLGHDHTTWHYVYTTLHYPHMDNFESHGIVSGVHRDCTVLYIARVGPVSYPFWNSLYNTQVGRTNGVPARLNPSIFVHPATEWVHNGPTAGYPHAGIHRVGNNVYGTVQSACFDTSAPEWNLCLCALYTLRYPCTATHHGPYTHKNPSFLTEFHSYWYRSHERFQTLVKTIRKTHWNFQKHLQTKQTSLWCYSDKSIIKYQIPTSVWLHLEQWMNEWGATVLELQS